MPQSTNLLDVTLAEWAYKSINSKLDNPGMLDKKNISVQKCFNPTTGKSQIMAYGSANKLDGAFVICEDSDGDYREIYASKHKLILSVQIQHPNIVLVCMDESGTGAATASFHLIRHTNSGYKNVWNGLANHYDTNYSPQFCFEVTAGISFSNTGELIHSAFKKLYEHGNPTNPVNTEKIFDIYKFDEDYMQYQFVRRF